MSKLLNYPSLNIESDTKQNAQLKVNTPIPQWCRSTLSPEEAATRVVENWYSEEKAFDYDANEYSYKFSHFCQLIWKGGILYSIVTSSERKF